MITQIMLREKKFQDKNISRMDFYDKMQNLPNFLKSIEVNLVARLNAFYNSKSNYKYKQVKDSQ